MKCNIFKFLEWMLLLVYAISVFILFLSMGVDSDTLTSLISGVALITTAWAAKSAAKSASVAEKVALSMRDDERRRFIASRWEALDTSILNAISSLEMLSRWPSIFVGYVAPVAFNDPELTLKFIRTQSLDKGIKKKISELEQQVLDAILTVSKAKESASSWWIWVDIEARSIEEELNRVLEYLTTYKAKIPEIEAMWKESMRSRSIYAQELTKEEALTKIVIFSDKTEVIRGLIQRIDILRGISGQLARDFAPFSLGNGVKSQE